MSNIPTIIAHRGASSAAPENTQAAFVLAWMQGADAIEGDFRLTKDGHIVCIHDEVTDRTGNRKGFVVAKSSLAALKELEFGGWLSPQWKGQRIQTLEEVLAGMPEGRQLFLEVKCGTEILEPLKEVLGRSANNVSRVVIQSFEPELIRQAKKLMPEHKMLLVLDRKRSLNTKPWSPSIPVMVEALLQSGADGLNVSAAGVLHDANCAPAIHETGKELHVWTVNRAGNANKLGKLGVKSISTDRPGWLRQHVRLLQRKD